MTAKGAVAAGHERTVRAAEIILQDGGNAFDAALGALCAATVAEPVLCSLGGGGFLLAQPADGEAVLYDFFCQTPRRRDAGRAVDFFPILADFGPATQEFHIGMASIATPGTVRGIFAVHAELGHMPLRQIVAPAAAFAREGQAVSAFEAYLFTILRPILTSNDGTRRIYCRSPADPTLLTAEEIQRVPEMADCLEALVDEGADLFYRGEMGRRLIDDCAERGGYLAADDLAGYRVERRRPLRLSYHGAEVLGNPPPSSGGLLIAFALSLLADRAADGLAPGGADHLALLARVMALTNKARMEDGLHDHGVHAAAPDALFDPALMAAYRAEVAGLAAKLGGTTHVNVVDGAGNTASLSLSNGEGAGYVLPGTGMMLNNMLGEEDLNPDGFHVWPEDTRISSMMAPTMLRRADGSVVSLGSGGSNRIRTAILQVLLNLVDFGADLRDAVVRPRIHFENGLLSVEDLFGQAAIDALARDYPDIERWPERNMFFGGVHAVQHDPARGRFDAAGDPRRHGAAKVIG